MPQRARQLRIDWCPLVKYNQKDLQAYTAVEF